MNKFKNKMKLNYSLSARTYPVLIVLIPIIIGGIYFSINLSSFYLFLTSMGAFGAFSFLLTQLGRDLGKKKEPKLWKEWGGTPSVQILRHRNDRIDEFTKKRYHTRLFELCPTEVVPTVDLEQNNPDLTDNLYLTWTKFMISNTRDTIKYNLLFKENVNYGFRRNLWGLKPIAISLIVIVFSILTVNVFCDYNNTNIESWPKEYFISVFLLIVLFLFWIGVITKNWIKQVAFAYAERLFELTEEINVL